MNWSVADVVQSSAAWVSPWFPPGSVHVDLGWLEFYVAGGAATVMRVVPGDMTAAELVGRVLGELRGRHVAEAFWAVGPGYSPQGTGQALLGLGASVNRTIDICARPLEVPVPDWQLPGEVTVRPVRAREDVACYERVSCAGWGYPPPSDADVDRAFAGLAPGYFVGCWNETPAGAGGYTLAGPVARLWGAAVVPRSGAAGSTGPWSAPGWPRQRPGERPSRWSTPSRCPRRFCGGSASGSTDSGRYSRSPLTPTAAVVASWAADPAAVGSEGLQDLVIGQLERHQFRIGNAKAYYLGLNY